MGVLFIFFFAHVVKLRQCKSVSRLLEECIFGIEYVIGEFQKSDTDNWSTIAHCMYMKILYENKRV